MDIPHEQVESCAKKYLIKTEKFLLILQCAHWHCVGACGRINENRMRLKWAFSNRCTSWYRDRYVNNVTYHKYIPLCSEILLLKFAHISTIHNFITYSIHKKMQVISFKSYKYGIYYHLPSLLSQINIERYQSMEFRSIVRLTKDCWTR